MHYTICVLFSKLFYLNYKKTNQKSSYLNLYLKNVMTPISKSSIMILRIVNGWIT
jgi:hypothetical protein